MPTIWVKTARKPRAWATTADAIVLLGRSARQKALTSAKRSAREQAATRLTQFIRLNSIEQACKLMRADLLLRLVDEDGLRPIDIARATVLRQSDLSQMYATAKMFPPDARPDDVPYNIFLLAMRMVRKFPTLRLRAQVALAQIRRLKLSQHRDVCRHFAQLAREADCRRALPPPRLGGGIIDMAHHARFQDLLPGVPDGSAKIIHVDPPYIYRSTTHGGYSSRSSRSRNCDNANSDAAIALVIDLLRDWQPKLAPGGVLLLWQASGPLLREIMDGIEQFDGNLTGPVIWNKSRPQPGDFSAPYSRQTEMLWVLSRPGDDLMNHDGSSRSDILRFPPVSVPSAAGEQDHCFEKPQKLCEFLIRKHSHRGELVLDICGCTGSMTLATIQAGRRWMYVESHIENYRLGTARIANRLATQNDYEAVSHASVISWPDSFFFFPSSRLSRFRRARSTSAVTRRLFAFPLAASAFHATIRVVDPGARCVSCGWWIVSFTHARAGRLIRCNAFDLRRRSWLFEVRPALCTCSPVSLAKVRRQKAEVRTQKRLPRLRVRCLAEGRALRRPRSGPA